MKQTQTNALLLGIILFILALAMGYPVVALVFLGVAVVLFLVRNRP